MWHCEGSHSGQNAREDQRREREHLRDKLTRPDFVDEELDVLMNSTNQHVYVLEILHIRKLLQELEAG